MTRRALTVVSVLACVAGCVRISQPSPVIREFRLEYAPPAVSGTRLSVTVRVPPLDVAAIYDREPIVFRSDAYSTGTYFYTRWSTNPGQMLADLLARDLSNSGLYSAVKQGPSALPSDYQLSGRIEEIEEHVGAAASGSACTAHLRLRLLLLRVRLGPSDSVLLQKTYAEEAPCSCHDARSLAAAMSGVAERISAQLQPDVYAAVAADVAGSKR